MEVPWKITSAAGVRKHLSRYHLTTPSPPVYLAGYTDQYRVLRWNFVTMLSCPPYGMKFPTIYEKNNRMQMCNYQWRIYEHLFVY